MFLKTNKSNFEQRKCFLIYSSGHEANCHSGIDTFNFNGGLKKNSMCRIENDHRLISGVIRYNKMDDKILPFKPINKSLSNKIALSLFSQGSLL